MKIKYFLLINLLLISNSFGEELGLNITNNQFYLENDKIIKEGLLLLKKCDTRINKITLDFYPKKLELISQDKNGEVHFLNNKEILIEFNLSNWKKLSLFERNKLILHELGHSVGMDHSDNEISLMFNKHNAKGSKNEFLNEIRSFCKLKNNS